MASESKCWDGTGYAIQRKGIIFQNSLKNNRFRLFENNSMSTEKSTVIIFKVASLYLEGLGTRVY